MVWKIQRNVLLGELWVNKPESQRELALHGNKVESWLKAGILE